MRSLLIAATACLTLSGCAAFQGMPTPTACEQTANQIALAQGGVVAAQLALAIAQQIVNNPDAITKAQNSLNLAQQTLATVTALYNTKCSTSPPAPPATS